MVILLALRYKVRVGPMSSHASLQRLLWTEGMHPAVLQKCGFFYKATSLPNLIEEIAKAAISSSTSSSTAGFYPTPTHSCCCVVFSAMPACCARQQQQGDMLCYTLGMLLVYR